VIDSLLDMYMLSLGEFNYSGYKEGGNEYAAFSMFILASMVIMIVMLNFIITIMGQPFELVRDNADIFRYKQKIEMILNNIDKVSFEKKFSS